MQKYKFLHIEDVYLFQINTPLKAKINTVRKLSYECALLGSVYLQVVSSTDNMVSFFFCLYVIY